LDDDSDDEMDSTADVAMNGEEGKETQEVGGSFVGFSHGKCLVISSETLFRALLHLG
jgi:hypothetical protein